MATDTQTARCLEDALGYGSRGWQVVPILPRDKRPRINAWQKAASSKEAKITSWWTKWDDSNVGIRLGRGSNLVDIECDGPEAEETYQRLVKDYEPITPTYTAHRGKHRLVRWRDDLPEPTKAVFKIAGLEIRTGNGGKGAQSVFPPSIHPTGAQYRWLVSPDECEPAKLPDEIVARMWNWNGEEWLGDSRQGKSHEEWERITQGVGENERNISTASLVGKMTASLGDVFDNRAVDHLWLMVEAWNRANKPPLPEKELRTTFQSILNRERRQRTDDQYKTEFERMTRPRVEATNTETPPKSKKPESWNLTIVDSKPQTYRLESPLWYGYLDLTTRGVIDPAKIREEAMEQKRIWVPGSFDKLWKGTPTKESLARQLVESADVIDAPPEKHRDRTIAGLLLDQFAKAVRMEDDQQPIAKKINRLADGGVVFKFNIVWEPLRYSADEVKRNELSAVLELVDVAWWQSSKTRGARFKLLTKEAIDELDRLANQGGL